MTASQTALGKIPFRVTQGSANQTAFNFPRNFANAIAIIDEAHKQGSNLVALEELFVTAYDAGDDFQRSDNAVILEFIQAVADYMYQKDPNMIASIGHPYYVSDKSISAIPGLEAERQKNPLFNQLNLPFNVQSFIGGGRILSMTAKMNLFNHERGYEKRYFQEWSMEAANALGGKFGTIFIEVPGQSQKVPFGRPIIQLVGPAGAVNLTHIICEEKWMASRFNHPHHTDALYDRDGIAPSVSHYVGKDGLVLVISNASPPSPLKNDKHVHLAGLASAYADAVIDTDGLGSSGSTFAQFGHRLVMQDGQLISNGSRLNFARTATTTTTVMLTPADPASADLVHAQIEHHFTAAVPLAGVQNAPPAWDNPQNPDREAEEITRMAALWLFDYMRKTKSQGIAEALSGGADSSFNSAMVSIMVRLAVDELGVEGFCREMPHLRYNDQILAAYAKDGTEAAIDACMQNMLTTVYMGTNNSSDATRNAARFLAEGGQDGDAQVKGIGGKFLERNVQDVLDFYAVVYAVENTSALDPQRKLALQAELADYLNLRPGSLSIDALNEKAAAIRQRFPEIAGDIISAADPRHLIAYENIQARARQVLIMLIANAEGKMAVSNPNLDEARNSYATFGGDLHAGTVNLNGFISKEQELLLMQHLYEKGLHGIPPVKGFKLVLGNVPTAELQPKDASGVVVQSDEDSLQRNFAQMRRISELMLHARTGEQAERRLNPTELFDACKEDQRFKSVDDVRLHNMVRLSYFRWAALSQYKIHASAITPTWDKTVDHQTSMRTPNISGNYESELAQLGVRQLFAMAKQEFNGTNPAWDAKAEAHWMARAKRDEVFVSQFDVEVRRGKTNRMEYNIEALFERVKVEGLAAVFKPNAPAGVPPLNPSSLAA